MIHYSYTLTTVSFKTLLGKSTKSSGENHDQGKKMYYHNDKFNIYLRFF